MRNLSVLGFLFLIFFCYIIFTGNQVTHVSTQIQQNQSSNYLPSSSTSLDLNPLDYVNPFIGTGGHGHTTPAASVPFGMVHVGPDTRLTGWDGSSGYHYNDTSVIGFSHIHLSGTGGGAYGLLRLLPTIQTNTMEASSTFTHDKEVAIPGYYKVQLDTFNITAEMSASKRSAIHQYTFPESNSSWILVDKTHAIRDEAEGEIHQVNSKEINGYITSHAWKTHTIYFHAMFSKDFSYENVTEGALISYSTENNEQIHIKIGISFVSMEQAELNLLEEIPDWNFTKVREEASKEWKEALTKIEVTGGTDEQKEIFYTALYHSLYHPQLFSDVNGLYRGMDGEIYNVSGYNHYSVLSLWDTFRAEHPLLLLLQPDVQRDVIKTLIADYEVSGWLPKWKLANQETNSMIGTHADSIITDSYVKGITNFDVEQAWQAMYKHAMNPGSENNTGRRGIEHYISEGFVPSDLERWSTSRTLEFAYDDFCLAQLAEKLDKSTEYILFTGRAKYYQNLFYSGFMRGRTSTSGWEDISTYDPRKCENYYIEGNGWQWTWSTLHDIQGLINLMGGDDEFEAKLDQLFTTEEIIDCSPDVQPDIGNYAHSNEPSHHIPYLYNYIDKPWKTQEKVRQILNSLYQASPEGLAGNEDAGQLSAWCVFSAMGFYPVTPGHPSYTIGSPIFDKITIHLTNGDFLINVYNNSV
ncbi:MAG: GH92 family glycosyl hydrolase, partial [Candidatus Heimdallarchaeota archaeon]